MHTIQNVKTITKGRERYQTKWNHQQGVFETPQGKFIVRIRAGKNLTFTTISQHNTKEEAERKYKELNKK